MDCTATSLSNSSPGSSLTASCEAINTNVQSECWFTLGLGISQAAQCQGITMTTSLPSVNALWGRSRLFLWGLSHTVLLFSSCTWKKRKNFKEAKFQDKPRNQCHSVSRRRLYQGEGGVQEGGQRWWGSWYWDNGIQTFINYLSSLL